jgi:hypothetical protein
LGDFFGSYPSRYTEAMGPLRPVVSVSLRAFLRCGDLAQGFARIRCAQCEHEYLLPFTCKKRGACPSCHQRRSADAAAVIAGELCLPVPHRHIVLTVPRALRWVFRRNREHLSLLYAAAREAILLWLRERTGQPSGEIAAVAALHTFGDYLVFHPHLHLIAASGVFNETGGFHLAPPGGHAELSELFRHAILRRFVDAGVIEAWQAHRFLSWRHSGFHVDVGEAPLAADDAAGRQRLAEYLLRAPLSLEKMHWNAQTRTVLYRSARSWHTKRSYEIFSGADFIAALAEHIPEKHAQMIRYYGRYSNKRRTCLAHEAAQRNQMTVEPCLVLAPPRLIPRRRRAWRALIIRVWGADPLRCPCCGGLMSKIGVIKKPETIRTFLVRLGLWEGAIAVPPAHAPPQQRQAVAWGVDTWDGRLVEFEPGFEREILPTRRLSKAPRECYFSYSLEDSGLPDVARDGADESQVLDPPPPTRQREDGLLLVFDADPPPPDDLPVFWQD